MYCMQPDCRALHIKSVVFVGRNWALFATREIIRAYVCLYLSMQYALSDGWGPDALYSALGTKRDAVCDII